MLIKLKKKLLKNEQPHKVKLTYYSERTQNTLNHGKV